LRVLLALLLIAAGVAGCQPSRAGYERAPCRVVRSADDFELRDYAALVLASPPAGGAAGGMNGGFGRLCRFLAGRNEPQTNLALPTPVFVSRTHADAVLAFVMPAKMQLAELPRPAAQVRRFSGPWRPATGLRAAAPLPRRRDPETLAA